MIIDAFDADDVEVYVEEDDVAPLLLRFLGSSFSTCFQFLSWLKDHPLPSILSLISTTKSGERRNSTSSSFIIFLFHCHSLKRSQSVILRSIFNIWWYKDEDNNFYKGLRLLLIFDQSVLYCENCLTKWRCLCRFLQKPLFSFSVYLYPKDFVIKHLFLQDIMPSRLPVEDMEFLLESDPRHIFQQMYPVLVGILVQLSYLSCLLSKTFLLQEQLKILSYTLQRILCVET